MSSLRTLQADAGVCPKLRRLIWMVQGLGFPCPKQTYAHAQLQGSHRREVDVLVSAQVQAVYDSLLPKLVGCNCGPTKNSYKKKGFGGWTLCCITFDGCIFHYAGTILAF